MIMEHNSDGDAAFPARGRLIIRSSHHRATAALVGLTRSRCLLLAFDRRFALSLCGGAFGSGGDDGAGWGLCQRGLLQEYRIGCIPCMPMQGYYYRAAAAWVVGGGGGILGRSRWPAAGLGSEGRAGGERTPPAASACTASGESLGVAIAAPWAGSGLGSRLG